MHVWFWKFSEKSTNKTMCVWKMRTHSPFQVENFQYTVKLQDISVPVKIICLLKLFSVAGSVQARRQFFKLCWFFFISNLSERNRMVRYKPQKAHEGIHKSPLCWLIHIVPNFSWADIPYVSLVVKWTQQWFMLMKNISATWFCYTHTLKMTSSCRYICNVPM